MFTIWMTAKRAKALGCTHYAWSLGLIPGFFNEETDLWISRSDLLNPIEDALLWLWVRMLEMRGEDPDFMFAVGKEIP